MGNGSRAIMGGQHGERPAMDQFSPVRKGWCLPGSPGWKTGNEAYGREPGRIMTYFMR